MTNQTVLVTGGASGIGLAIARAVVAEGWRVIVADFDPAGLQRARGELESVAKVAPDAPADLLHFIQLDVTDELAIAAAIPRCESEVGPLTGVVNSAGIAADVPCLETTSALFRKLLDVNLVGSFVVAREAAKAMVARGRGSIVNIASVSGMRGSAGRTAYGASKAGVIVATQVMALELAPRGVRVNAICPGPIETALVKNLHTPEVRAGWIREVPQGRYAAPEEVAPAAIFLLDDARSSFVTGHALCVDGGFTATGLMPVGRS